MSDHSDNQAETAPTKKPKGAVMGWVLPAPRLTLWAFLYFGLFAALPFLGLMLLLDLLFYGIFTLGFGVCYGVLCLL